MLPAADDVNTKPLLLIQTKGITSPDREKVMNVIEM